MGRKTILPDSGERLGTCIFLRVDGQDSRGIFGRFICSCGAEFRALVAYINSGHTTSCGCASNRKRIRRKEIIHEFKSEYRSWCSMRDRCRNPNSQDYKNYGGRGISVCDRWNLFENFIEDMGSKPTPGHTLERNCVNKGYSPDNCSWIPNEDQPHNRTITVRLTYNGETKPLSIWAKERNLDPKLVRSRISRGMSVEKALSTSKYDSKGRQTSFRALFKGSFPILRPVLAFNQ
jgi:hypothetical protein